MSPSLPLDDDDGLIMSSPIPCSHPDQRPRVEARQQRGSKLKRLGDPPTLPASQNFGTYIRESSIGDIEVFVKLARGYVFEGADRSTVCAHNAEVSCCLAKVGRCC